jgi:enamine deaminase RidA (YjgF/YER057c/UK114 family)
VPVAPCYALCANSGEKVVTIAARLKELGLLLPAPPKIPAGIVLPFGWVRIVGTRALVSGHGPTNLDGSFAEPLGTVGSEVTQQDAYGAARLTALAVLASLERELGDLDRILAWTRVFGMVQAAPGFHNMPSVINGFSDLILEVFGPERGRHARSAVGVASLPFEIPVEIEAEVEIA